MSIVTNERRKDSYMNINYLLNNTFSQDIAIDIGTDTTLIYIQGKGIVLKEPSCIAFDKSAGTVEATGSEAKQMLGKSPKMIDIVRPIENGVISNYSMAEKMIKKFLTSVYEKTVLKPRIIASVPSGSTDVEQRAMCGMLKDAGARDVYLIEAPLAAASGSGCDISLARGMLIVDIGGGRCDAASISLGASVIKKTATAAGNRLDREIIKYVKEQHKIIIGDNTAEKIKCEIGCVYPFEISKNAEVYGSDTMTGLPKSVIINSEEIREVITPHVREIAGLITGVLEDTPPALQSDIMEDGILLTGGGAMLHGIDRFLRSETGIKIFTTEKSDECVINGVGGELIKLDNSAADKYYYTI